MDNPTEYKLDSVRVDEVFTTCLFTEEEANASSREELLERAITANGIINNVGFHPERLEEHKEEIQAMLMELPVAFRKSEGGGWSFLCAHEDRHGNQWTDLHLRMEQLFLLGIAANMVTCLLPRELWSTLPGRMPYYTVTCD
jgi:hypothetical protein